jgi:hypothetical protein
MQPQPIQLTGLLGMVLVPDMAFAPFIHRAHLRSTVIRAKTMPIRPFADAQNIKQLEVIRGARVQIFVVFGRQKLSVGQPIANSFSQYYVSVVNFLSIITHVKGAPLLFIRCPRQGMSA